MTYDTIIFDLDGTLLNTLPDLADSVNFALEQSGFPPRSEDEVKSFVGNGIKLLIDLAVPAGTSDDLAKICLNAFREHYSANMENKTCPYDGIMELLAALKKRNFKMAVVSNKFDLAVKALCKSLFGDYIMVAVGDRDGFRKKPAPDSVFVRTG